MGSAAEKKAGSGEVRCAAGTESALLQSGVRKHFINSAITAFKCSFRGERFLPRDQQV